MAHQVDVHLTPALDRLANCYQRDIRWQYNIRMNEQLASTNYESKYPNRFKPGNSGNPSGRPKADATIRELARTHTEAALATLVEIIQNKKAPPSARVHAASALLDRGWGKPAMYVESVNVGLTLSDWLSALPAPSGNELVIDITASQPQHELVCEELTKEELDELLGGV